MPELFSLDGARSRRRLGRGISATSDAKACIQCCITVAKGPAFGDHTRKRKASTPEAPIPELPDEVVVEILLRLPAKSLVHCRAVCKAWRAIVNDPLFVRAHLRWSTMRWEQEPSFLITPVTLDRSIPWDSEGVKEGSGWPTTNQIRFYSYQWQLQQSASDSDNGHGQQQTATFMHAKDFGASKSNRVGSFAHCDGLVLAPTDKELCLLNPATGDAVTLPESHRNNLRHAARASCHCVALGVDPRTGKYKVFQAFYRPADPMFMFYKRIPMGMEVFTFDGGYYSYYNEPWKETMRDPPCPLLRWQTGVTLQGFIFWRVDTDQGRTPRRDPVPRGLIRLSIANERFDIVYLPESVHTRHDLTLDALHGQGELCLTARTSDVSVTIWMMPLDGNDLWEPRYSITLGLPRLCHVMALVAGGSRMLLWSDFVLYEYDLATNKLTTVCEMDRMRYQGRRARKWKNLSSFNFVPYTGSLLWIADA